MWLPDEGLDIRLGGVCTGVEEFDELDEPIDDLDGEPCLCRI